MENTATGRILSQANNYSHLTVPIGAVVILLVLLVPLPAFLLDILISFNLMAAALSFSGSLITGSSGYRFNELNRAYLSESTVLGN